MEPPTLPYPSCWTGQQVLELGGDGHNEFEDGGRVVSVSPLCFPADLWMQVVHDSAHCRSQISVLFYVDAVAVGGDMWGRG